MKKILFILFGMIFFFLSCGEKDSIYNHKGDIIVEKWVYQKHPNFSINYFLYIRTKISGVYVIKKLNVSKFEYDLVELGDTIK